MTARPGHGHVVAGGLDHVDQVQRELEPVERGFPRELARGIGDVGDRDDAGGVRLDPGEQDVIVAFDKRDRVLRNDPTGH